MPTPGNDLAFAEQGLRGCWQNTQDLVTAARQVLGSGLHAPASSLSILALEELAVLFALDSLLYACNGEPDAGFTRAGRSHARLSRISHFPAFINTLSRRDARRANDEEFRQNIATSLQYLKVDCDTLLELLPGGFDNLHQLGHQGFYTTADASGPLAPRQQVDPTLAQLVYKLAWRATSTVGLIFKIGNLERYIRTAQAVRNSLTAEERQELRQHANEVTDLLFGDAAVARR